MPVVVYLPTKERKCYTSYRTSEGNETEGSEDEINYMAVASGRSCPVEASDEGIA